ncbi:hypothetical protein FHR81_005444 [Actinoalloteichus hoggarensis]|uniref:hypothetical protein n=1 Tax=Actinoalloteichus hoggarensis TaxID=1470176 RepID=UPI0017E01BCC|nr:hypothetical protein [Actinoalloteichus hoggarensis]MBB5924367.1 hypothetical protein [Actinoalloteichus hoggarensis]
MKRWNAAYREQTAALFTAQAYGTPENVRRLAAAYRAVSTAWRALAAETVIPLWARHAAVVAAEEFARRADIEDARATLTPPPESE